MRRVRRKMRIAVAAADAAVVVNPGRGSVVNLFRCASRSIIVDRMRTQMAGLGVKNSRQAYRYNDDVSPGQPAAAATSA